MKGFCVQRQQNSKNMKTFKLVGMALLAVVMSISFIACSSDNDDDKETLSGTTWKFVSIDNADEDFNEWTGSTATFNADGTVSFKPDTGWNYTRWTLNDNTLKIVLGEKAADDYIEGTLSISGTSASWNCYWADVDGEWTNKDKTHAIVHLQKQ